MEVVITMLEPRSSYFDNPQTPVPYRFSLAQEKCMQKLKVNIELWTE
jgi:hypothetical protein